MHRDSWAKKLAVMVRDPVEDTGFSYKDMFDRTAGRNIV